MRGWSLLTFVARRMAGLALLLVVISFVIFTLLYLAPGSAEQVLLGTRPSSPELREAIRAQYNLDEPFVEQYWIWLSGAAQLDFGESIRNGRPVADSLQARGGVTLFLGIYAFVIAVVVGLPLGILAALRKRSVLDRGVVGFGVLFLSAPTFVSGAFLLYVFAVWLGWFPIFGAAEGFTDRLWHLTLPAIALALTAMAVILKLTRTAMIGVLEQDWIGFARARGVPRRQLIARYALRGALLPIVTAGGIVLTLVLTGTVLVETTFALPGLGTLLVESVEYKDLPVLQGIAMLLAVLIVVVNLGVDLLYAAIDPRIHFKRGAS